LPPLKPGRYASEGNSAMEAPRGAAEKDVMLRGAFSKLADRGISSAWADSLHPFSDLRSECRRLMTNDIFKADLRRYLQAHATLPRAIQMFFTCISMAARAKWDEAPEGIRTTVARGWFIGRWLPTFLIIDGPVGRFLCSDLSPLNRQLGTGFPFLTGARDFLNDRTFRLLRNGFAHWGFDWEVVGSESYVVAYDPDRDLPTAKLHQGQADAFHIITFALVEVLDSVLISQGDDENDDA
jgi:hypothetical protein